MVYFQSLGNLLGHFNMDFFFSSAYAFSFGIFRAQGHSSACSECGYQDVERFCERLYTLATLAVVLLVPLHTLLHACSVTA